MNNIPKNNVFREKFLSKIKMTPDIVKAKGCYLFEDNGNEILDCLAQFGAVPLGHNSAVINNAVVEYLENDGPVFIQPFTPKSTCKLSHLLCHVAGDSYHSVVFANSGAETVEAAIKLARMKTRKKKVLSAVNSFHGKTFCALSATGSAKYSNEFIVDNENFDKVLFNKLSELEMALSSEKYAAFIVEAIQGEGGMVIAEESYLQEAQKLCKQYGTLFILDEIQTGLGRTGMLFAKDKYGLSPDILLLSKALGGGIYPIGAAVVKKSAYCKEFDKKHSSTFANGGLGALVAQKTIEELTKNDSILNNVKDSAAYIKTELETLSNTYRGIFSFQGDGLMYALRFQDPNAVDIGNIITSFLHNADVFSYLICGYLLNERRILCMPFLGGAYGSIRFEPSLIINREQLGYYLKSVSEICEIIKNQRYDILMGYLIERKFDDNNIHIPFLTKSLGNPVNHCDKKQHKFAFFIHSTSIQDTIRVLPPSVRGNFSQEELMALSAWVIDVSSIDPTAVRTNEISMKSKTGTVVSGVLVASPIGAQEMMKLPKLERQKLIEDYIDEAGDADVIGLGAYTSVVTRAGKDIEHQPYHFTTGNSFTALSTAEAVKEKVGTVITEKSISIIGAKGTVGRLAFLELSQYFCRVNLVGNPKSGTIGLKQTVVECMVELLENGYDGLLGSSVASFKTLLISMNINIDLAIENLKSDGIDYLDRIEKQAEYLGLLFPFFMTTDIKEVAADTDYVFSATSEGKPFISTNIFSAGTVIYDVARPFDFVDDGSLDVEVIEGGIVNQPEAVMFSDSNLAGNVAGVNLACLSETIALTMEGIDHNYSIGQKILYQEARFVYEICVKHGFSHYASCSQTFLDTEKLTVRPSFG
jgi:acetylornithine/succinyldiaminopimelate/putrescine aminotransferase/predicted amino acid dehydrogenase